MSGGQNQKFLADPAGYARGKIILLPIHGQDGGFWSKVQDGPFDLVEVSKSGFPGTVLALTHMTLRGKEQSDRTQPIQGIWVPYKTPFAEEKINAKSSPYFVFTSRLGGCAVGIRDLNSAETLFVHDADTAAVQKAHLKNFAVKLMPGEYDPQGESGGFDNVSETNISAFFWWDKNEWHRGFSKTYNTEEDGLSQTLVHADDKYPKKAGGSAGK